MPWFLREDGNGAWLRTETAPNFAPALIDLTASGQCLLLVPPDFDIAVNGEPVQNGAHILQHRDEVATADTMAYFTGEKLPQVVAFSGAVAKCGRCRSELREGCPAVRCVCGLWFHASDPCCFEYGEDPVCIACGRPTRLDGSGLWCPEEE